jgi:hypothetical protein
VTGVGGPGSGLVEALRADNGWLEYRLQVVQDTLLDQGAQVAEDASAIEKVTSALLERDEASQAREDLAAGRSSRRSLLPLEPSSSSIAQPSRGRGPGRVRLRRKPRRLSG